MIFFYVLSALSALAMFVVIKKTFELNRGKAQAAADLAAMTIEKISDPGSVRSLRILPLIDYYADRNDLKTEPGVSYLLKADDTNILLDVGFNRKKAHPSPLLHNMAALGVTPLDIDRMFISHAHLDHLGGMTEQKMKTFSLSQGPVEMRAIPVLAPVPLSPSHWNPGPRVQVVTEPAALKPGIFSIGVIPRYLFLMGRTLENALAVNVEGKGIVLVIGCGHQTIERIIDRTRALFDLPIHAIIGGLHFPVRGGRINIGPINIQRLVGSDKPPWAGLSEADVESAIAAIKAVSPKIVALSPHDSSDWSLARFREAFGEAYQEIRVGKEIVV